MRWLAPLLIALPAGFAGAALWDVSGMADRATRAYLLANPEVLPEAIAVLERREQARRVAPMRAELEQPFPGAVLGNPDAKLTLVEFSDYACGYCRQSLEDVATLLAENPDLKVVVREYPILSQESADAARMALAAAQQGRYARFHDAMFRLGPPSAETIEAAAREAGVDIAAARAAIERGDFEAHLRANMTMANVLGLTGTPGWVIGERTFNGAVGAKVIGEAIEEARES